MKQKLVFIIQNTKDRTLGSLILLTVFVIILLYSLKLSFENGTTPLSEIGIFIVLGICFTITFQLAYSFVDASKSVEALGLKTKMDPLTRLKNREAMLEDASNRVKSGNSFCIIFLDLDNFKTINDNYGHNIGDDYLVSFANSARRLLDSHDKLYRISGDEFVVLKDGKHCVKTCEEFEKLRFLNNPSGIEFLGLSTGFANYPEDSKSISELLGTADSKMYQNKKTKHKLVADQQTQSIV
jgi:diguanylate cyclase (GGDEF)-like protein